MKRYSKVLFLIIALMLTVIAGFSAMTVSYRGQQIHVTQINDMVESVEEHWEDLDHFDSARFHTEMLIFSNEDFLLYSTAGRELAGVDSPAKAMQEGCLCLSIHEGSRYLGTLVIPDPAKVNFHAARRKLIAAAVFLMLGMVLAGVLYGIYVRQTIIRPFRKMEQFAVDVAAGKLDEPLMLEQNNLFGAFTQSFDIMREELKASRRHERELKLKEKEIIASLSHDLKTPITGIKLICELLAVKVQDEYVLTKIENIHQKAEQISVLVSDLLASALDELGEMQVTCRDETSAILHELVAEHDTRTLVTESAIPECMIEVDRLRVSQIIGNILSNSYKYAGTPIDIGYRLREGYLEMSIRDYGEGVPESEIGLVTTKFYRGQNSDGKDGSGLGLYIASILMEKMNGELICSCREQGFLVTVLLPLS